MITRRNCILLAIITAISSTRDVLAANCSTDPVDSLANSIKMNFVAEPLKGVAIGAVSAAALVFIGLPAGTAAAVFVGVSAFAGVGSATKKSLNDGLGRLETSLSNFQVD